MVCKWDVLFPERPKAYNSGKLLPIFNDIQTSPGDAPCRCILHVYNVTRVFRISWFGVNSATKIRVQVLLYLIDYLYLKRFCRDSWIVSNGDPKLGWKIRIFPIKKPGCKCCTNGLSDRLCKINWLPLHTFHCYSSNITVPAQKEKKYITSLVKKNPMTDMMVTSPCLLLKSLKKGHCNS